MTPGRFNNHRKARNRANEHCAGWPVVVNADPQIKPYKIDVYAVTMEKAVKQKQETDG
jgi:hypothetical protein